MTHILAIDQGTTSSRAIVFGPDMRPVATAQEEFPQIFPDSGWVEHDPEDIWNTVLRSCQAVIAEVGVDKISAIGITNQRETTVVWDRATGKPIYNAIVWQDRRTAPLCETLRAEGYGALISNHTGLLLDPYFSATKLAWILDNVPGARERAEDNELAFGTIDSFLIYRLTGGISHVTDATNAARTMLYDIREGAWCDEITALFDIPPCILPEVYDCAADFGTTDEALLGAPIPIHGVAGDQQAATVGQACFAPGMLKSTYGTGCFALLNTGEEMVTSRNRLLTTIAYQLNGITTYAIEGSIFIAGAAVQWLRDGLGVVEHAAQTGDMARQADPTQDIILVPAFTGLGAPYWDAEARGAMFGMTRNTGPNEFARAALEAVGYQTTDLIGAMRADWSGFGAHIPLKVDGGMAASDYAMQFLADVSGRRVERPKVLETTALGVAWLAGMYVGLYPDQKGFTEMWSCDAVFEPQMPEDARAARLARWKDAVNRTLVMD